LCIGAATTQGHLRRGQITKARDVFKKTSEVGQHFGGVHESKRRESEAKNACMSSHYSDDEEKRNYFGRTSFGFDLKERRSRIDEYEQKV